MLARLVILATLLALAGCSNSQTVSAEQVAPNAALARKENDRAFALIQRRHPEASLTVAADGWQRPELEELARTLGLRNTEFVGAVPFEKMPDVYDSADVYLTATNLDNMPGSIVECLACRVLGPCTRSPLEEAAGLLPGQVGLLEPAPNELRDGVVNQASHALGAGVTIDADSVNQQGQVTGSADELRQER